MRVSAEASRGRSQSTAIYQKDNARLTLKVSDVQTHGPVGVPVRVILRYLATDSNTLRTL